MPYRDDKAALESRRDELRAELADATHRAAALADATADTKRLERELTDVEAKLRRAMGTALPLLDSVKIASPCTADWDAMKGDDRVRFCGSCEKNVYNLSEMPRIEAEALLAARGASLCVRLYRRADGTVISGDCSVGAKKKQRRRVLMVAVAGVGAGAFTAIALTRTMGEPALPVSMGAIEPAPAMMGEIEPAPATMGSAAPPPAVMGTAAPSASPTAAPNLPYKEPRHVVPRR